MPVCIEGGMMHDDSSEGYHLHRIVKKVSMVVGETLKSYNTIKIVAEIHHNNIYIMCIIQTVPTLYSYSTIYTKYII